ncbi:hypothetical protein PEL8287_00236 [Roseovarius litorisediminis]|uniref:DoxX n=1 Tax=Roseovarius litorisediminis TaxID=1312363 RepID=A0A1Y5R7X8_9RHOB|nr:hypothetical protein [Roseovarius litorisediminis]SLN11228.1 hypothetical protein PEL8287_00236 [Roseovarius litorisediminis]
MAQKNDRWLDQTGMNIIRIVIGSYFLGASLDLVDGVDQTALLVPFINIEVADLIGSTLLFSLSVAFMTGIFLRTTALMLALFVLCSSIIQNFVAFDLGNVSDFWRDLTLVCAVILNYSNLGRREIRKASVLARRARARHIFAKENVTPRRVTPENLSKRPVQRDIRNALFSSSSLYSDEDSDNIFANI